MTNNCSEEVDTGPWDSVRAPGPGGGETSAGILSGAVVRGPLEDSDMPITSGRGAAAPPGRSTPAAVGHNTPHRCSPGQPPSGRPPSPHRRHHTGRGPPAPGRTPGGRAPPAGAAPSPGSHSIDTSSRRPAGATVQVAGLPKGARGEIEMVARVR